MKRNCKESLEVGTFGCAKCFRTCFLANLQNTTKSFGGGLTTLNHPLRQLRFSQYGPEAAQRLQAQKRRSSTLLRGAQETSAYTCDLHKTRPMNPFPTLRQCLRAAVSQVHIKKSRQENSVGMGSQRAGMLAGCDVQAGSVW